MNEPDNVLSQHPVHHDDHGPDQLEASAEEEEVGACAHHDAYGEAVLEEDEDEEDDDGVFE